MTSDLVDISVKGKTKKVPAITINHLTIIISGRLLRLATVKGEFWTAGDLIDDPERIIAKLKQGRPPADIFTFSQKLPHIQPKYSYPTEWDNVAAIPITTFPDWWENRLSQVTRKNVRRSARRGTVVRKAEFNDDLINGIVSINNESQYRDGRPFWHYGKDFKIVKRDYSDYLDRSEFYGAYFGNELIGLLRILYLGEFASIMQLLCKNAHFDKRPANALIARAVEICAEKKLKFLVYGKYIYDDNSQSPLTEFKRRCGFEQFAIPSYFIPLTLKGRLAIKINMHLGYRRLIPRFITRYIRTSRRMFYEMRRRRSGNSDHETEDPA